MKITTLTAEQLELKENGTAGVVVGACLASGGVLAAIFMRQSSPFAIWIALALILAGILVILFSSSLTLDVNKRSGQLRYQKKRIVGTQDLMYLIADVFRIETANSGACRMHQAREITSPRANNPCWWRKR